MNLRAVTAVLTAFAATTFVTGAHAADGVKRIGVTGGFAGVAGNEGTFAGGGGGVTGAYPLSDAWLLRGDAVVTSNQVTAKGGRSAVFWQSIGAQYALDVLQIVPYFGFHAGLYEQTFGGVGGVDWKFGLQVSGGLDWVVSRSLIVGLEVRLHALPQDFVQNPTNPTPFYVTSFLRAEYAWGWF
jgi:hypothetical protein